MVKLTKEETEPDQIAEYKHLFDKNFDDIPMVEDNSIDDTESAMNFEKASLVKNFAGIVFEKPKVKIR